MAAMQAYFKRFLTNENGATAIEYGLIAALIAVVIITGLTAVGANLNGMLGTVATSLR
jgi:pilus assembly protein Flp/PilA